MKTLKPKINFIGFTEIGTGGGCTAMEYTLPYKYNYIVTDEAEVPLGDEATLGLEVNGSYCMSVSIDFAKRSVQLNEDPSQENAQAVLTLENGGCRIAFRHKGTWVQSEILLNWKTKTMEVLA